MLYNITQNLRRMDKARFFFNPYAADGLIGQYKIMQKSCKPLKPLANGYSSESV